MSKEAEQALDKMAENARELGLDYEPAQLPFGVGGGLVAIKTLLSRDPCAHANTAIQMIDAILAEQPASYKIRMDLPASISSEAIEADKLLKPQPAQQPTNCRHCGGADNVLCAGQCKVQPAQQEPVAWMTQARNFVHLMEFTEAEAKLYGWSAVYTSPPAQRKPLTDMQVDGEWILVRDLDTNDVEKSRLFARAIEAAHGIKENT